MSFPPEWGCGRAGQSPVVRSCGENAQTHGFRGGWGGPSATHETGLTDCTAGSYLDVRDGWDPFSARPAGRERPPPKNGPRSRKRAIRGGRSRDLSLQEGPPDPGAAQALTEGVRPVPHRHPDSRPRLGRDSHRHVVHFHGTVRRSAASNAASKVSVAELFPCRPIVFSSYVDFGNPS